MSRDEVETFARGGRLAPDLRDWPVHLGAPVLDGDGVPGNYDLAAGDRPAIPGDESVRWVMNDRGGVHERSGTPPIGLEVRVAAFAFDDPGVLGRTTFYRYRLTHRGDAPLDSAWIGLHVDTDLGHFDDDYIGSDTLLQLGYTYNADDFDEDLPDLAGYGAAPPAFGVTVLQGPRALPDVRDNDRGGAVDEAGERHGMTAFSFWIGGGGITGAAVEPHEFLNVLRGRWNDGRPFTVGGFGIRFSETPTSFFFPGDPVTGAFWSERNTAVRGAAGYAPRAAASTEGLPPPPPMPVPLSASAVDEQRALVALSLVPGVGPGRIRALRARFGSALAVLTAPRRALAAVPGIGPATANAIAAFSAPDAVGAQLARAEACGAHLVAPGDAAFPALLREIYDPPAYLWVRGRIAPADAHAVAIVGTRRATDYGRRLARTFAAELAAQGVTIVSGLAYGIDAAAHEGALEAGGRTLAVLGSGVDRVYPSRHLRLARRITEAGALLSEYPLGAAPDAVNFPRRNRLVAGLAWGTLVVEAYETGGALITARLAIESNREVFAVPSPLGAAAGVGANRLVRDGAAKLVTCVDDVLEELPIPARAPASTPPAAGVEPPAAPPAAPPADLAPDARRLLDALTSEPVHLDALCLAAGLDPSTALVHLLGLELRGLVRQLGGRQFYRPSG